MKQWNDRAPIALCAVVLAGAAITGAFTAAAAGGDQEDPLITLSYLTQVVTPELLNRVDEQVEANEQALADRLDAAIDEYSAQMELALAQSGGGESAAYAVVTVAAGQTIHPAPGCELLLRSGAAAVASGPSPALMDATAGSALEAGMSLVQDHLYLAPQDGAALAVSSPCTMLIRGSYSLT